MYNILIHSINSNLKSGRFDLLVNIATRRKIEHCSHTSYSGDNNISSHQVFPLISMVFPCGRLDFCCYDVAVSKPLPNQSRDQTTLLFPCRCTFCVFSHSRPIWLRCFHDGFNNILLAFHIFIETSGFIVILLVGLCRYVNHKVRASL